MVTVPARLKKWVRSRPPLNRFVNRAQRFRLSMVWRYLIDIRPLTIPRFYVYRLCLRIRRPQGLKLHLGCGKIKLPCFVNIDHRHTRATDFVCSVIKLPYLSDSVDRIESYHLIEHISHTKVRAMLREWHRVLKPDGQLVIECPDFDKAIERYQAGEEQRLMAIFGLHRFPGDVHLFGYNFVRLKRLLEECGFGSVTQHTTQDYHGPDGIRAECRKLE